MVFQIIITVLLACISAILYRCGGQGKPYNTLYRDLGCSLINTINIAILGSFSIKLSLILVVLASWGLLYGALTTYNDWLNRFFPKNNPKRTYWYGYLFTGMTYGLALSPYLLYTRQLLILLIRTIILSVGLLLINKVSKSDVWEDRNRGFLLIIANLLCLSK